MCNCFKFVQNFTLFPGQIVSGGEVGHSGHYLFNLPVESSNEPFNWPRSPEVTSGAEMAFVSA